MKKKNNVEKEKESVYVRVCVCVCMCVCVLEREINGEGNYVVDDKKHIVFLHIDKKIFCHNTMSTQ